MLNGIQESADRHGYDIITFSTRVLGKEMDSLQILSRGTVDGIIIAISEETINKIILITSRVFFKKYSISDV